MTIITSLIGVSDHWYSNIDNEKANSALCLDLKKAFDTVDYEILISKLVIYGRTDNEKNCFKSYLLMEASNVPLMVQYLIAWKQSVGFPKPHAWDRSSLSFI